MTPLEQTAFKERKKHLELPVVTNSDYPYRIVRKRTGVILGMFKTREEMVAAVLKLDLQSLATKPQKGRSHS